MIKEFTRKVASGEIDLEEYYVNFFKKLRNLDKRYSFMNYIAENEAFEQLKKLNKNGKLTGVPVTVKDCICVKGIPSTAGSYIINNYKPPFDATVIEKLKREGAVIVGKTSQDEFGFGSFGVNVGKGFRISKNPFDETRSCGGSSSGSACATYLLDEPHISIAESTGGSIAEPASYCGVTGLTPTYGAVSRYGLISYANSLDKIGVMSKNFDDVITTYNVIKGEDIKDPTTVQTKNVKKQKLKQITVGINKNIDSLVTDKNILNSFYDVFATDKIKIKEVETEMNDKYGVWTYYLLAMCEASTNLAKYCGIRYGLEPENVNKNYASLFSEIREEGFGSEAKRRIIIGTFARMTGYRGKYYLKAAKVRTLLIKEYKRIFKNVDVVASPTMPMLPPKFTEIIKLKPEQIYAMDLFVSPPNLAGLPHINFNIGESKGLPIGAMLIGDHFSEQKLINSAMLVGKDK